MRNNMLKSLGGVHVHNFLLIISVALVKENNFYLPPYY